jgi:hypothetical protein
MIKRAFIFLALLPTTSFAFTCNMLSFSLDDARTQLRRAINESDFEYAKDYARKARSALDDASMSAMDCGCLNLQMELDDAATKARRARDAYDADEFVSNINRAIRGFNSSIELLKSCRPRKR